MSEEVKQVTEMNYCYLMAASLEDKCALNAFNLEVYVGKKKSCFDGGGAACRGAAGS